MVDRQVDQDVANTRYEVYCASKAIPGPKDFVIA